MSEDIIERGTPVEKVGGDAPYTGTVLCSTRTLAGRLRYVVEFDAVPGLLHIESPNTIRRRK